MAVANTPSAFTLHAHIPTPLNPNCHPSFEGLHLLPYHTGAGLNDATFSPNSTLAASFPYHLNGTALQLDLGTPEYRQPYSVNVDLYAAYNAFTPVTINAGYAPNAYGTFFANETGLQWRTSEDPAADSFGGWLVCQWAHGVPQLFTRFKGYGAAYPASCEEVQLLIEPVAAKY